MFDIVGKEAETLHNWLTEHDKTCSVKHNQGAIGGRLSYCFTPTSLGIITVVKCACGEEIDISEYDW